MHFRKHAVFTSCGDRSKCFELWSGKNRKYDLICSYYGNDNQYLKKYSKDLDGMMEYLRFQSYSLSNDPNQTFENGLFLG